VISQTHGLLHNAVSVALRAHAASVAGEGDQKFTEMLDMMDRKKGISKYLRR
jgi:hypothetical protein